jgi:hypothetical protein
MSAEVTTALSGLVVPVTAAERVLGDRTQQPARPVQPVLPAHVTLLAPFLPREELTGGLVAELEALFADVVPFAFALDEVCAFPSGIVYLAPQPPAPFRQLTMALTRRFPEHPPYGGQFPELVPHLTVPLGDGESVADVERRVLEEGPVQGLATEAELWWVTDEGREVVAVFPFGTTAA